MMGWRGRPDTITLWARSKTERGRKSSMKLSLSRLPYLHTDSLLQSFILSSATPLSSLEHVPLFLLHFTPPQFCLPYALHVRQLHRLSSVSQGLLQEQGLLR